MGQHINFTKKSIAALSAPISTRTYHYDKKVNGLGLTITCKGSKSFFVYRRVHGTPKRLTLGKYPDLTVEQARKQAVSLIAEIANGKDPLEEKRAKKSSRLTLQEVFDDYLDTHNNLKPETVIDYKKAINGTFSDWLNKPLSNITEEMVLKRHKQRGQKSKARANNSMRVLRAIFNFSKHRYKNTKGKSFFSENPVGVLSYSRAWYKVERKKTYIKGTELQRWYRAVESLKESNSQSKAEVIRDYLFFILLTGTRRNEAARLKWEDVCFESKTFTLRDTKNSEEVTLPLSSFVYQMLRERASNSNSNYVFPGNDESKPIISPKRQIRHVIDESGIQFSIHDLRRTFITIGESLDISHYTLKRLVNHKSIESQDVTAGYIIPNMERLSKASQQITDYIIDIVNYDESERVVLIEDSFQKIN